jgi:hypothetical protein
VNGQRVRTHGRRGGGLRLFVRRCGRGGRGDELRSGKKDLPCSGLIRRCHIGGGLSIFVRAVGGDDGLQLLLALLVRISIGDVGDLGDLLGLLDGGLLDLRAVHGRNRGGAGVRSGLAGRAESMSLAVSVSAGAWERVASAAATAACSCSFLLMKLRCDALMRSCECMTREIRSS